MNTRLYVSMVLICISLLAILISSGRWLAVGRLTQRIEVGDGRAIYWRYDRVVREAGYARMTIAATGLLILFIPFRKRELWAWLALTLVLFTYVFPPFIIPLLVPFAGWHIFYQGIFQPGLARDVFLTMFYSALMLLGLALSATYFFRKRAD